jgi:putative nucleotidyltransferase with HDIG domain
MIVINMPALITSIFASISLLIILSCLFLYFKSNRYTNFLYACFPFICSVLILYTHIQLTTYATPATAVYWTKMKYIGVFGYLTAFPLFISSLSKRKVKTTTIIFFTCSSLVFFFFTFFTDLVISNRVVNYGNALRAKVGILYPYLMLVFFGFVAACLVMYIRMVLRETAKMKSKINYTPITIGLIAAIVFAILDVLGLIIGKPVFKPIPYPFTLGTIIFVLAYLWSFLSQYSWFFITFDETQNQIIQLTEKSNKSFLSFVHLIARTLDAKDHYTAGHSLRVMDYAVKMARALDLREDEIAILKHACLLHDIGKIGIPDGILNKETKLTENEREHIYNHPVLARKILSTVDEFRDILDIIYAHHERVDGKGYPNGLKQEEIPLLARILAVADTYDAMLSERPYRKALTKKEAIVELRRIKNSQLDDKLVDLFITSITRNNSQMS